MKRQITKEDKKKFFESRLLKEDDEDQHELAVAIAKKLKITDEDEIKSIEDSLDWEGGRYSSNGRAGKFEADGDEYNIIESEDEAERIAIEQVSEMLSSEPETFNKDFIKQHIYITDTDRRLIAVEEAGAQREQYDDYIDKEDFESLFSEIEKNEDQYEALAEKLSKAEDDEDEDLQDEIKAQIEKLAKDSIEEWESEKADEIEEALKDPIQYFVKDQGIYTEEELFKASFIRIETEAAAKAAVDEDGWIHFLNTYDRNYEELPSGHVFFRE